MIIVDNESFPPVLIFAQFAPMPCYTSSASTPSCSLLLLLFSATINCDSNFFIEHLQKLQSSKFVRKIYLIIYLLESVFRVSIFNFGVQFRIKFILIFASSIISKCDRMCVCVRMCVCMHVYDVCVYVGEGDGMEREKVRECGCVFVCVYERERGRERDCVCE